MSNLQKIIDELKAMNEELQELNDRFEKKEKSPEYVKGFRDGWVEGMNDAQEIK
jgi:flagellar biosynthesis/type III secretory pathway protein FliH